MNRLGTFTLPIAGERYRDILHSGPDIPNSQDHDDVTASPSRLLSFAPGLHPIPSMPYVLCAFVPDATCPLPLHPKPLLSSPCTHRLRDLCSPVAMPVTSVQGVLIAEDDRLRSIGCRHGADRIGTYRGELGLGPAEREAAFRFADL